MKKSLLFILFCCMGFVAKAQTIEEIKILDANEIVPVCIFDAPTAYKNGTTINIRLGETATSTVTVINKETGEPAYSMIYAGTDNILFDLKGKAKGTYTLLINIEGMKYTGEFTL